MGERVMSDRRTPRQRWGTCCPHDPECDHSFITDSEWDAWVDKPITDNEAAAVDFRFAAAAVEAAEPQPFDPRHSADHDHGRGE